MGSGLAVRIGVVSSSGGTISSSKRSVAGCRAWVRGSLCLVKKAAQRLHRWHPGRMRELSRQSLPTTTRQESTLYRSEVIPGNGRFFGSSYEEARTKPFGMSLFWEQWALSLPECQGMPGSIVFCVAPVRGVFLQLSSVGIRDLTLFFLAQKVPDAGKSPDVIFLLFELL